jgi:hypothetical protein
MRDIINAILYMRRSRCPWAHGAGQLSFALDGLPLVHPGYGMRANLRRSTITF